MSPMLWKNMTAGKNPNQDQLGPNPEHLIELANYRMPFGKYKGELLLNLPEAYFVWFKQKGFPDGKLGRMMQEVHELKINGIEGILRKLVKRN